jgi:hypothetical protein
VRPPTKIRRAVISPLVSVPVLSEQITVVHPSVSTAGIRRTSALRFAISCIPTASAPVTMAASASGTAATASAIANIVIVSTSWRLSSLPIHARTMLTTIVTAQTTSAISPSQRPTSAVRFSSGDGSLLTVETCSAILPNSVCMPVEVTIALPRP